LTLRAAPLRVSIFRPAAGGKSGYAEYLADYGSTPLYTDERFDLQPIAGMVDDEMHGRKPDSRWRGFGEQPDLRQGDGVYVISDTRSRLTARRFLVTEAHAWDEDFGDWQGVLVESGESFGP